ncbi:MAG TPA: hypothetical protein VIF62_04245 [Labilithrix sp.]
MRRGSVVLLLSLSACSKCDEQPSNSSPKDADAPDVYSIKMPEGGSVVNATPMTTASVAAMVNPENLPIYDGPTGSVEGTIWVTGDPPVPTPADFSRCPDAEKIWGASFRQGPPNAKGARPLADAIVGVTGYKGIFVPEKEPAKRATIAGCGYEQRTVTMTLGQELDVYNEATQFWTPILEPGVVKVMRMLPPHADPAKLYPQRPGHYLLLDNDRRYAVVDVYVFLHPLHTATTTTGTYRIDGIPVGKVRVSTTHPRFEGEVSTELDVKPNVVNHVELTLDHKHRDAGPAVLDEDAGRARPPIH